MIRIGTVRELTRYPVKSMAGIPTESAVLGWHGLEGDRRFAFRRLGDRTGFPWLNASRHPEMLLYQPFGVDETSDEPLPTHVRTPGGVELEFASEALVSEIERSSCKEVELMKMKNGIFDDAPISIIALSTIQGIGAAAGMDLDHRRFRANIVLETNDTQPFGEDGWIGGTLVFGDGEPMAAVSVTTRDPRCMMINLDPDTAEQDARVLRTVVRMNQTDAGVYCSVLQPGTIHVGQAVKLVQSGNH